MSEHSISCPYCGADTSVEPCSDNFLEEFDCPECGKNFVVENDFDPDHPHRTCYVGVKIEDHK